MSDEKLELRPSDAVNLAGQETGRDHLSHSSIATLLNCQKKYDWHYMQRLELVDRPRPLGMGSAFHKAIEVRDPHAGANALREGRQVFGQDDEDSLRKDEAIVVAAATLYLERWGSSEKGIREFEYRVRLRSPWTGRPSMTFDLLGYADELIDAGAHHELTEVKFVGRIDAGTVRRLPLDRQVALASYGIWRATGKPVRVVHYRHIKKPSIRQKQNESVEEFCERLTADYQERPDFYLDDQTLFRSDEDLLLIEAELWRWAGQLREAKQSGFWARNTSVCGERGGCRFLALCTGDLDAGALYQERPERVAV